MTVAKRVVGKNEITWAVTVTYLSGVLAAAVLAMTGISGVNTATRRAAATALR